MMDKVVTVIRLLILLLCAVLFLAGALWNLCLQPEKDIESMDVHNMVYAENSQETVDVFFKQEVTVEDTAIQDQQIIENRLAALRMERDAAWQQLYRAVETLEFTDKQQTLQQYAEMQYNEQRLELLLKAKEHLKAKLVPFSFCAKVSLAKFIYKDIPRKLSVNRGITVIKVICYHHARKALVKIKSYICLRVNQ
jgi:hypothetical protein